MKTIDEIQCELRDLIHELELIKEERSSGEFEIDWERISVDACTKAIKPHPLEGFDEYSQKCYITILLTVAWLDEQSLAESLFLAHRIAFGIGYLEKHGDLRDEFIAAKTLSYKQLDELSALFADKDEKLMLILECLLIAGTFEKGKNDAVEYIAKLSELLGLTKENMVFLSNLAAVVLTQDTDNYKCEIQNKWCFFDYYLSDTNYDWNTIIVNANDIPQMTEELDLILVGHFRKCDRIVLKDNQLRFDCTYGIGFFGVVTDNRSASFVQNVQSNFILLAEANAVKPNYPIGVIVDPLISVSLASKQYDKAVCEFNAKPPVKTEVSI